MSVRRLTGRVRSAAEKSVGAGWEHSTVAILSLGVVPDQEGVHRRLLLWLDLMRDPPGCPGTVGGQLV
ncbi:MAG: hypothetical protein HC838_03145 [Spirulinaceae cyanobacterium RM2_2_10]|nr:hypothetical protein [Spirulinaceae cyanobacterium RM2_2_10]